MSFSAHGPSDQFHNTQGPQMTPRERLLAALRGEATDRLAWAPMLAYWWEALPPAIQKKGQLAFLQEIGADPLMRGTSQLFRTEIPGLDITETVRGKRKHTTYATPVGKLEFTHTYVEKGNTWFLTEHPVKQSEDFTVLQWMNEKMRILPNEAQYEQDRSLLGNDGLILPLLCPYMKSSFQSLIEHWVGTEELTYMLADDPAPVLSCLAVMQERTAETVRVSVSSEAEGFIFWEDSSTTNITPTWFQDHIAPEISQWSSLVHAEGKLLIHHACGHIRSILGMMAGTGIDAIESISPPPTGNVELWEAKDVLPDHIRLIGGIEPTVFLGSTEAELTIHVHRLMEKMGNKGWILSNSDSCPPGVSMEKFHLVTRLVREHRFN